MICFLSDSSSTPDVWQSMILSSVSGSQPPYHLPLGNTPAIGPERQTPGHSSFKTTIRGFPSFRRSFEIRRKCFQLSRISQADAHFAVFSSPHRATVSTAVPSPNFSARLWARSRSSSDFPNLHSRFSRSIPRLFAVDSRRQSLILMLVEIDSQHLYDIPTCLPSPSSFAPRLSRCVKRSFRSLTVMTMPIVLWWRSSISSPVPRR